MVRCENRAASPFAKTICSICYEDLKPIVEDIQSISICGHVFHELCIQQWFEYCSNGKKCPVCKQTCSASSVSRLYFQSVGDPNEAKLSQKLQTLEEDPEELLLEIRRLEGKVKGLNSALESRQKVLNNINDEFCLCKEQLKKEASLKNEASEQTRTVSRLLNLKTQELNKSELECIRLQERNMILAKELAALKLVSDLNLEEEEILKLASLGTKSNSKESIDVLKKSLVVRNKMYKELISKCNILGRDEARSRKKLEKAKDKIHKLKTRIQDLETANEIKENEVLRALKTSNKTNISSRVSEDKIKEAALDQVASVSTDICCTRETKRLRGSEDISIINNEDGGRNSYIVIDDDAPEVPLSHKSDGILQPNYTNEDDKPLNNITKENSLPVVNAREGDLCFSGGLLGPDGTNWHLGKWCKRGHNRGPKPKQGSPELIAVGADGRGGRIKVLRSHNSSSLQSKESPTWGKNGKFGAKTSGCMQIDQFFRKAAQ